LVLEHTQLLSVLVERPQLSGPTHLLLVSLHLEVAVEVVVLVVLVLAQVLLVQ
jgi:hypothetical protein